MDDLASKLDMLTDQCEVILNKVDAMSQRLDALEAD